MEALILGTRAWHRAANAKRTRSKIFEFRQADVFEFLSGGFAERGPKIFDGSTGPAGIREVAPVDLDDAARGYKEINLRAMRLLDKGGVLVTCSCSHHMSEAMLLRRVAAGGARCGQDTAGTGAEGAGAGPSDPPYGTGDVVPEVPDITGSIAFDTASGGTKVGCGRLWACGMVTEGSFPGFAA